MYEVTKASDRDMIRPAVSIPALSFSFAQKRDIAFSIPIEQTAIAIPVIGNTSW